MATDGSTPSTALVGSPQDGAWTALWVTTLALAHAFAGFWLLKAFIALRPSFFANLLYWRWCPWCGQRGKGSEAMAGPHHHSVLMPSTSTAAEMHGTPMPASLAVQVPVSSPQITALPPPDAATDSTASHTSHVQAPVQTVQATAADAMPPAVPSTTRRTTSMMQAAEEQKMHQMHQSIVSGHSIGKGLLMNVGGGSRSARQAVTPVVQVLRRTASMIAPTVLDWEDVSCTYDTGAGPKVVLQGAYGRAAPGDLLALLGPSGSGKSTLMDILAMRKGTGHIGGVIRVNGAPRAPDFLNKTAYVPQDDHFLPTLTTEEVIFLHADLVLPPSSTVAGRRQRGRESLAAMGLVRSAQTLPYIPIGEQVGGMLPGGFRVRGLSGGERKRLAIATGILAFPSILFLDEPTSGLDSFAALSVMQYMRAVADTGHAVIASLHQPRSAIWNMCSKAEVLSMGRMMYYGPRESVVPWFHEQLGYDYNPTFHGVASDWVMDLVNIAFPTPKKYFGRMISSQEELIDASTKFRQYYLEHGGTVAIPRRKTTTAVFIGTGRPISRRATANGLSGGPTPLKKQSGSLKEPASLADAGIVRRGGDSLMDPAHSGVTSGGMVGGENVGGSGAGGGGEAVTGGGGQMVRGQGDLPVVPPGSNRAADADMAAAFVADLRQRGGLPSANPPHMQLSPAQQPGGDVITESVPHTVSGGATGPASRTWTHANPLLRPPAVAAAPAGPAEAVPATAIGFINQAKDEKRLNAQPMSAASNKLQQQEVVLPPGVEKVSWLQRLRQHGGGGAPHRGAGWMRQVAILLRRNWLAITRNPSDVAGRMLLYTWVGLFIGIVYYNLPYTYEGLRSQTNLLYIQTTVMLLLPYVYMSLYMDDKQFYIADMGAKLYSTSAYYVAKTVALLPFSLANAAAFTLTVYGMIGLPHQAAILLRNLVILLLVYLTASQVLFLAATVAPNQDMAFLIAIAWTAINILLSGFLVRYVEMTFIWVPTAFRWFATVFYGLEGMADSEFKFQNYNCSRGAGTDVLQFLPKYLPNTTGIGFVANLLADPGQDCVIQTENLLQYFNVDLSYWQVIVVMLGYLGALHILTYIALLLAGRKERR